MRRFLKRNTIHVAPRSKVKACRDPDDDFLLDLALAGRADYLLTGDEDLLSIDPFRSVRIVTYRIFRELLEA